MPTRTILVVEDDPNDEALTLRALRQCGVPCSVVVAHTAPEALDYLLRRGAFETRASPDPYVVFVDNALPGSGGCDFVSQIREHDGLDAVPLVVFSGSSDLRVVERCARAGANSFIEKPMEMSDYMSLVGSAARYWLELNRSPQAANRSSYPFPA